MNKMLTVAIIAGGLLLLDAPEAAAHKEVRHVYQPPVHVDHRWSTYRPQHMPRWLKRDRKFRKWFRRTHLRHYRSIAWRHLYEIYLWERFYVNNHRRHDRFDRDYRRHADFDDDSDRRRRNRH